MKKIKYIFLALIGLVITLSSCSDGSEINETLEIDDSKVEFTYAKQSKEIPFTVSKGETIVVNWDGGGEWDDVWGSVSADQTSGKVIISVEENTTAYPREASVLISLSSGWRNQLIKVAQGGSNDAVSIPERVIFDYMGCAQTIPIEIAGTWSVKTTASWVHAQPYLNANELVISLDRNEEFESRTTTVTIIAGSVPKEIVLNQEPTPFFLFPFVGYNDKPTPIASLMTFEKGRHNRYVGNSGYAIFSTDSPMFPDIRYGFTRTNGILESMMSVHPSYNEILANDYPQYLLDNDFEYLYSRLNGVYYWLDRGSEEGTLHCMVRFVPGTVYFYPELVKPAAAGPTFAEFPYPELDWGIDGDAVKAWEAENGGTRYATGPKSLIFELLGSTDLYLRGYDFKEEVTQNMNSTNTIYHGIDKFYYKIKIAYDINTNLIELLNREGFEYIGVTGPSNAPVFKNIEKSLVAVIMAYNDPGGSPTDPPQYAGFTFHPLSWLDEPVEPVAPGSMLQVVAGKTLPPAPKGLQYAIIDMDME